VNILWEDQRGVQTKSFGPHELLIACVADELVMPRGHLWVRARDALQRIILSQPKKGIGNVRVSLQRDVGLLDDGPVFAVVDRDKVRDLWKEGPPPDCMSGIADRFRQEAPGNYDLVFLVQNVESLVEAACLATNAAVPQKKPDPDRRDRLLVQAVWTTVETHDKLRQSCLSFDRLVRRVADKTRPHVDLPDG